VSVAERCKGGRPAETSAFQFALLPRDISQVEQWSGHYSLVAEFSYTACDSRQDRVRHTERRLRLISAVTGEDFRDEEGIAAGGSRALLELLELLRRTHGLLGRGGLDIP
jgi:hypothetical protein